MLRGMYASNSSLVSLLRRQEAMSQNLANVNTPGFKQEMVQFSDAGELPLVQNPFGTTASSIGGLSVGVDGSELIVDYTQGPLENTRRSYDLAILGDGFFRVQTPNGDRLTRDGSFTRDMSGHLCTAQGYYLLGENGPIQLPAGTPTIVEDGSIYMPGGTQPAARISLAQVPDLDALQMENGGLYNPGANGIQVLPAGRVTVKQGYLEQSNVDVSGTMVTMMTALRSYEATQRSFKLQDEALQRLMDVGRSA